MLSVGFFFIFDVEHFVNQTMQLPTRHLSRIVNLGRHATKLITNDAMLMFNNALKQGLKQVPTTVSVHC